MELLGTKVKCIVILVKYQIALEVVQIYFPIRNVFGDHFPILTNIVLLANVHLYQAESIFLDLIPSFWYSLSLPQS